MCLQCKTCKVNCYCPRCPKNPDCITGCPVCGAKMCMDSSCIGEANSIVFTEHFQCIAEVFCQICVEETHGIKMTHQLLGMFCSKHKDLHKQRMRDQVMDINLEWLRG